MKAIAGFYGAGSGCKTRASTNLSIANIKTGLF